MTASVLAFAAAMVVPLPSTASPPSADPSGLLESQAASAAVSARAEVSPHWRGTEAALPFATEEDLLSFLEGAPITHTEQLDVGLNKPLKVTLEQDGIRLHAVFRTVQRQDRPSTVERPAVRDHYLFEKAAFELDRLLGLSRVPPTVVRTVDGRQGTLQLWIEDAVSLAAVLKDPARHPYVPLHRTAGVQLFDRLIYNFDRHAANALYDTSGYLWLIDHTRSFPPISRLAPRSAETEPLTPMVKRLRELAPSEIRRALGSYLSVAELSALLQRRRGLLRQYRGLELAAVQARRTAN